jgi:hypothetical protein
MKKSQDFKEFIKLLHDHKVQYLIVGGYAFAIHAEPRFTKDLDVFIQVSSENASKVIQVLTDFGFKSMNLTVSDLTAPDQVIQLGYPPLRIDILTGISGIDFESAWDNKVEGKYDGQTAYFIGKEDLRKNKLATGRESDKLDAKKLK